MGEYHLAVVPVGKVDREGLEAVLARVARPLHAPIELRETLPVPQAAADPARNQYRAGLMLSRLADEVLKLRPGKLVGAEDPEQKTPFKVDGFVFVTDVDLFTANTDGAFAALVRRSNVALVSIRRQREAFYRRKADPNRQRSRLVKEILRMASRLRGLKDCADYECALSPTKDVRDLDRKEERFCRTCEINLFEGRVRI